MDIAHLPSAADAAGRFRVQLRRGPRPGCRCGKTGQHRPAMQTAARAPVPARQTRTERPFRGAFRRRRKPSRREWADLSEKTGADRNSF